MQEYELRVVAVGSNGASYICDLFLNSQAEASLTFPGGDPGFLMHNCPNSPLISWTEMKYYKKNEFKNLEVTEENILQLKEKVASIASADRPKLVSDIFLRFEAGQITVQEYGNRSIQSQKELNSPLTILILIKELRRDFSHLENA